MDLALNNLQMLICHKTEPTNQYSHGHDMTQGLFSKQSLSDLNSEFYFS